MTILSKLGLMRVSEHLSVLDRADRYLNDKDREIRDLTDKYKRAVTDLAASREQAAELLPDALAMRAKRKRDRDMKAAKRLAS